MTEEQRRKVEWSFDFESVGDRISQFVTDMVDEGVEVEYSEHFEPRDGATSAFVDIDFSVGKASLSALEPKTTICSRLASIPSATMTMKSAAAASVTSPCGSRDISRKASLA